MNVTKGTIMRTVFLGVTLALTDVAFIGMLVGLLRLGFIDQLAAGTYATSLIAANIAAGRAWWKNNSFTQNALEADAVLDTMRELDREGELEYDEIDIDE